VVSGWKERSDSPLLRNNGMRRNGQMENRRCTRQVLSDTYSETSADKNHLEEDEEVAIKSTHALLGHLAYITASVGADAFVAASQT